MTVKHVLTCLDCMCNRLASREGEPAGGFQCRVDKPLLSLWPVLTRDDQCILWGLTAFRITFTVFVVYVSIHHCDKFWPTYLYHNIY